MKPRQLFFIKEWWSINNNQFQLISNISNYYVFRLNYMKNMISVSIFNSNRAKSYYLPYRKNHLFNHRLGQSIRISILYYRRYRALFVPIPNQSGTKPVQKFAKRKNGKIRKKNPIKTSTVTQYLLVERSYLRCAHSIAPISHKFDK